MLLAVALVAGLATGAVARTDSRSASTGLTVALNGFEHNLTPFTVSFQAFPNTDDLIGLVYDTLFLARPNDDPEPWLAETATASADRRAWTVTLRPGLEWHDGRPLTAGDVKFSFDYYKAHAVESGLYARHVADVPAFASAEVLDARTVRIDFTAPAPQFEVVPGGQLPILPEHGWQGVVEPAKATRGLPVGSGPFRVAEIVPGQRYRLRANPSYFAGRPTVGEIDMPVIGDEGSAFAALRNGQADFVARAVPPELSEQLSGADGVELVEGAELESTHLSFNATRPPLSDARVRKAISLAIDNGALVGTVLLGQGRPGVDSFVHPDSPWALPAGIHERDTTRARRLLGEAGFSAQDPDGVRKGPDGRRLDLSVLVSSSQPRQARAIELVAQQLAPLGVKLTAEVLDPAALRQRRSPPGPGQAPAYDAYVTDLGSDAHVDPDGLYHLFHSPRPEGSTGTRTGYADPELDALVEQASVADLAERRPLLHRVQRILAEEAPVVVLWYRDGQWAYRPSAYEGWVSELGHGFLAKRSFLPGHAARASRRGGEDGGSSLVWPAVAAAATSGAVLVVVAARRRRHVD